MSHEVRGRTRVADPYRAERLDELRGEDAGILIGAKAIAAFARITERQAFRLVASGVIPTKRAGRLIATTTAAVRHALDPEAA
jgi:hypothetical protein